MLDIHTITTATGVFFGVLLSFCAAVLCYAAVNNLRARDNIFLYIADEARQRRGARRFACFLPYAALILSGALIPVLCTLKFDVYPAMLLDTAFLLTLCAVSLCDIKTMEIPDVFPVLILCLGVCAAFLLPEPGLISRFIGLVAVSLPMLLLALTGGFGGGDVKLMAACGFFLGWKVVLISALAGVLLGGLYGAYLLAARRGYGKTRFAFGPFLCAGAALGVFFGQQVCDWYAHTFFG